MKGTSVQHTLPNLAPIVESMEPQAQDDCSVCMSKLAVSNTSPLPVINACVNNHPMHLPCMKAYLRSIDTQNDQTDLAAVKCPTCRSNFTQVPKLNQEMSREEFKVKRRLLYAAVGATFNQMLGQSGLAVQAWSNAPDQLQQKYIAACDSLLKQQNTEPMAIFAFENQLKQSVEALLNSETLKGVSTPRHKTILWGQVKRQEALCQSSMTSLKRLGKGSRHKPAAIKRLNEIGEFIQSVQATGISQHHTYGLIKRRFLSSDR